IRPRRPTAPRSRATVRATSRPAPSTFAFFIRPARRREPAMDRGEVKGARPPISSESRRGRSNKTQDPLDVDALTEATCRATEAQHRCAAALERAAEALEQIASIFRECTAKRTDPTLPTRYFSTDDN